MVFTYSPFIVEPAYCSLTIKCSSGSQQDGNLPCPQLDSKGQAVWNVGPDDYEQKRVAPGSYTFTYDVTTSEGDPDLT